MLPFQDIIMLNGFGVVVNSLGVRVKPYLPQICGTILWRLNNKAAKVRQQAADLISRISSAMHECNEVSKGGAPGLLVNNEGSGGSPWIIGQYIHDDEPLVYMYIHVHMTQYYVISQPHLFHLYVHVDVIM